MSLTLESLKQSLKNTGGNLLYHHCRELDSIRPYQIEHHPRYADPDFLPSYRWLEKKIGFFPIFFAVGKSIHDLYMTGYNGQFRTYDCWGFGERGPRRKQQPNYVLFSYKHVPGIFTDFDDWDTLLRLATQHDPNIYKDAKKKPRIELWLCKKIFKLRENLRSDRTWIRQAIRKPYSVQLVTKYFDATKADRLLCRNQTTKEYLESCGYKNVHVLKIPADYEQIEKMEKVCYK